MLQNLPLNVPTQEEKDGMETEELSMNATDNENPPKNVSTNRPTNIQISILHLSDTNYANRKVVSLR